MEFICVMHRGLCAVSAAPEVVPTIGAEICATCPAYLRGGGRFHEFGVPSSGPLEQSQGIPLFFFEIL